MYLNLLGTKAAELSSVTTDLRHTNSSLMICHDTLLELKANDFILQLFVKKMKKLFLFYLLTYSPCRCTEMNECIANTCVVLTET